MIDTSFLDIDNIPEGHVKATEKTLRAIDRVFNKVQPKKVLEIGFNAGHSAYIWLTQYKNLEFHSIDICQWDYTKKHAHIIEDMFPDRFKFGQIDSHKLTPSALEGYDMVIIDGDHSLEGITNDFKLCVNANVPYILIDDYYSRPVYGYIKHAQTKYPYEDIGIFNYDSLRSDNTYVLLKKQESII